MSRLSLRPIVTLAAVLMLLAAAGLLWWACAHSESIAFLPARAGAEWIIHPRRVGADIHEIKPITARFRHCFTLGAVPAKATLAVCVFKGGACAINGREVSPLLSGRPNWKLPSIAEVARLLQPGTNEITVSVTNSVGPPALWLRLEGPQLSVGTDEGWQVALGGAGWQRARRATQPIQFQPDASAEGSARMTAWLKQALPLELAFLAVSLALLYGTSRWLQHRRLPDGSLPAATAKALIYGLLAFVLVARAALFINNLPQVPRPLGFDASDHEKYIGFIQQKHALPLANDGWQMFQPPLYYLVSTLVMDARGLSVADENAVYYLRAINGVVGLLHCWLVLLCLRLLFEGNIQAQAAGLLVAAFLPPNLYLSQYVTNEPLAALLVTLAFYCCLRMLRAEPERRWLPLVLGVALGAAMLTKFSVLLALPVVAAGLAQRLTVLEGAARRRWLLWMAVVVAFCLLVCGWHYGRVWARFGKPIIGNWEMQAGQGWWQDPGFRTSSFYLSFGQALVSPFFSAFHSFADGIYSTLWGDGLASGVADRNFQPPWNYSLMGAGYWISLGISLLLIIGAAVVLVRLVRQFRAEWFLILGTVCVFGAALFWMTLRIPSYAQAKAFYALPALLPFSALVAVGWDWLRQRHRVAGAAAWTLLLVWALTVYTSFWIRGGNSEAGFLSSFEQGTSLMEQGKLDEAIDLFRETIRLKGDNAEAHYNLGFALGRKGQLEEAISQFQEAVRLKPDYPEAHNNYGIALGRKGQLDEAIKQFKEAIRLKPDYAEAYCNLGLALDGEGQTDEALRQFERAVSVKPDYAEAHYSLGLLLGRKGKAEDSIRQFQEAVRLKSDNPEVYFNLGLALGRKGQVDEAIRLLDRAIALKPEHAEAHNNLGIALGRKGQADQAIHHFEMALKLKPDYAAARKNLEVVLAAKARASQQPGPTTKP